MKSRKRIQFDRLFTIQYRVHVYVLYTELNTQYTDRLGTRLPVIARRSRELVLAAQELVATAKLYSTELGDRSFELGLARRWG